MRVNHAPAQIMARGIGFFAIVNILFTCFLGWSYLASFQSATPLTIWAFGSVALFAQLSLLVLLWTAPALLLVRMAWGRRIVLWALPLVATLFAVLLLIDRTLFALMRLHISSLVINVVTTPGGWATLGISQQEMALYAGLVFVLSVAQWALLRMTVWWAAAPLGSRVRPWSAVVVAAIFTGALERGIYAVGDLQGNQHITQISTMLPLYQPTTIKKAMTRWFGWEDTLAGTPVLKSIQGSSLRYPRDPLVVEASDQPMNMIWIVVDSWRSDMIRPEVMPQLLKRSEQAQVFTQHLSGGNSTRFGIFSLLYGLYGSYWEAFLSQRQPSLLFEMLRGRGYDIGVHSSTVLTFPEFRQTAFVNLGSAIADQYPGERSDQRDKQQVDGVVAELSQRVREKNPRPFFKFMFLDGPHGPYNYPEEYTRFKPIKPNNMYTTLASSDRRDMLFNDYRNALTYTDALLDHFFQSLAELNLDEHTIVLLTGDHGEEFFEQGFFGHAGAYTNYQSQVPMLVFWPGMAPREFTHLTSHHDVVPTFAAYLGAKNPLRDYALGRSLFLQESRPYRVICNWEHCALYDQEYYLIFGTRTYNSHYSEFRNARYELVSRGEALQGKRPEYLMELMRDMTWFLAR